MAARTSSKPARTARHVRRSRRPAASDKAATLSTLKEIRSRMTTAMAVILATETVLQRREIRLEDSIYAPRLRARLTAYRAISDQMAIELGRLAFAMLGEKPGVRP